MGIRKPKLQKKALFETAKGNKKENGIEIET